MKADSDGGYYAIKGFVFQFDKSLLTCIASPNNDIEIEHIEDINTESYFIQVKYKETQKYAPSKVKKAVRQLLDLYSQSQSGKYELFCFFKDMPPKSIHLDIAGLDLILGKDKDKYQRDIKQKFVANFSLNFAENFNLQFKKLINSIKNSFNLMSDEEAIAHHAIFRAHLLEVATIRDKRQRIISLKKLKELLSRNERVIFEAAYSKHLSNGKYLNYIKKEYFTFKKVNVKSDERLFIVDVDKTASDTVLTGIVSAIQGKYFVRNNSPAPFIYLHSVGKKRYSAIKRKLWSKKLFFADGTHFADDEFRLGDIKLSIHEDSHNKATYKLISDSNLKLILKNVKFDEVTIFSIGDLKEISTNAAPCRKFYIHKTADILKVLE